MRNSANHSSDRTEIYAMVSCGHKQKADERNENFFVSSYTGMADAAKLLDPNSMIEWHGPNAWDPLPEIEAVKALMDRKVGGIILSAADKEALNPAINEAIDAGIPVITFDADAPESERLTFVGTNNYEAGYLAGKAMTNWIKGRGDVAISTMEHGDHFRERVAGFEAAMQQHTPKTHIYVVYNKESALIDQDGRRDYSHSRQNYKEILLAHPEIQGLFATFAAQGDGAALAVDDLRMRGKVRILAFDFDEDTTRLITDGEIRATVGQDPYLMGYVAMILTYFARHAPKLPFKQDGSWRITALTEFLDTHLNINKHTTAKITAIISALKESPGSPPIAVDTGVEILGKDELLGVLARNVEDMRESIHTKIEVMETLNKEIEERNRLEKTLEEERVLLHTLIDTLPDYIYAKDSESRFLLANRAVTHLMGGKSPKELLGKTDFDFFPKELAKQYYEDEQALIKSEQSLLDQEEPVIDQETGAKGWLLTTKVPFRDSLGKIAGFVGIGRNITKRKQTEEALQKLNKELAQRIKERTAELEALQSLMKQVMSVAKHLGKASEKMNQISAQMATGARQTSQQVSVVSSNSQQISQHVTNVSSAIEEVAASIREIFRAVTDVTKIVTNAVDTANDANVTITSLETHSKEIEKISKVINNIAGQTKFLSLNATIEAARAGEAGEGFKVVANEVKDLARESSESAEDIASKIEMIRTSSQGAVSAIAKVAKIINQISELSNTIAAAITQQTETANEISRSIADAAQGSDEISHAITEVAVATQYSSEQAESVRNEARKLSSLAEQLRQLVESFKMETRQDG